MSKKKFDDSSLDSGSSSDWVQDIVNLEAEYGSDEELGFERDTLLPGLRSNDVSQSLEDFLNFFEYSHDKDSAAKIREAMLQWQMTREQRESERQYDSASAQIGRLEEAGLSRQSAISMLTGAGSAGSGASGAQQAPSMPMPSETAERKANAFQSATQGVANIADTLTSIADFGFSVPIKIDDIGRSKIYTDLMNNEKFRSDMQNRIAQRAEDGMLAADDMWNLLHEIEDAGGTVDWYASDAMSLINSPDNADSFPADNELRSRYDSARKALNRNHFAKGCFDDMFNSQKSTEGLRVSPEIAGIQQTLLEIDQRMGELNVQALENELKLFNDKLNLLRQQGRYLKALAHGSEQENAIRSNEVAAAIDPDNAWHIQQGFGYQYRFAYWSNRARLGFGSIPSDEKPLMKEFAPAVYSDAEYLEQYQNLRSLVMSEDFDMNDFNEFPYMQLVMSNMMSEHYAQKFAETFFHDREFKLQPFGVGVRLSGSSRGGSFRNAFLSTDPTENYYRR